MAVWSPLAMVTNIDLCEPVIAGYGAIVSVSDERVLEIIDEHPSFLDFISRFRTEFDVEIVPSVILIKSDGPRSAFTSAAMVGIRNALSVATVLRQTASELLHPHGHRTLFTDQFAIYPWMIDRHFERMISITPAQMALHRVEEFAGRSLPGVPVQQLRLSATDRPLLATLLERWQSAFRTQVQSVSDSALFRSLNMADAAMRMPAGSEVTFLDPGRSIANWVSAFEVLAHEREGRASRNGVFNLLLERPSLDPRLNRRHFTVRQGRGTQRVSLPLKLYDLLYQARNDFLHGNPVTARSLRISRSGRYLLHFAPLLYRTVLANFLPMQFQPTWLPPNADEMNALSRAMSRWVFLQPQRDCEAAIRLAVVRDSDEDA